MGITVLYPRSLRSLGHFVPYLKDTPGRLGHAVPTKLADRLKRYATYFLYR